MAAPPTPNPNRGLLIAVIAVGAFLLLAIGLLVGLLVTRSSSTVATSAPATTVVARGSSGSTSSSSTTTSSTTTSSSSTTTTTERETTTTRAPATTTAPTTAPAGGSLSQTCVANAIGLRVHYPGGWSTSTGPDVGCQLFDPEPFTVPVDSEFPFVAVYVSPRDEADLTTAVENETGAEFAVVDEQQSLTLGGRDAVCVSMTSTGMGLLDAGTRMYLCVVDLGARTLVVGSNRPPGSPAIDYDATVREIAGAIETL